jgi:hypothetical protein
MKTLVYTAIAVAVAAVPFSADAAGFCDTPFTVLVDAQYSAVSQPMTWVLENDTDYCDAWDMIHSNQFPAPPCNSSGIDFSTETAIMVALGWRSNGCYNVNVSCVHEFTPNAVGVVYTETQPGPGCFCSQAIVNPVQIVKVEGTYSRAMYRHRTRNLQCGP